MREIRVDLRVYSLNAVKKTLYKLADRASFEISSEEREARIIIRPTSGAGDANGIEDRFWSEILDQDLRESVAKETEPLRNLILAHALSRTAILRPDLEAHNLDAAVAAANQQP